MLKMDLKKIFVVGTAGFIIVCLSLFYILTNSIRTSGHSQHQTNLESMEHKLEALEVAIKGHRDTMKELETLALSDGNSIDFLKVNDENYNRKHIDLNAASKEKHISTTSTCSASVGIDKQASSNINMLDVYEVLKFDNPNGGVWKQGWNVQIDTSRFSSSDKLKVYVIPHSHNDPGWIKTFEKYFEDQTKHILDSMLNSLSQDSSVKFIWAEISYFHMWWTDLNSEEKAKVLRLVENKQLEFVTGGWVMPDEANAHFYGILLQLTEGHQWLLHHLNYVPKNGWAIDPFGMSPTMAYFLRRTGLSNMLIQRTHYNVKKHLAQLQQLEFKWRQLWDASGSTDMFCHMMPFYSYDVPHTCGPDPKICCQFDFKRMRGVSTLSCPWNVPPQPIITQNIRERSLTLLDQYKKKAMLYKTNTLLVPLGDDFRWENKAEWEAQVGNYKKLFDYINSQPELFAEVKFGTLDDYFKDIGMKINDGKFIPEVLTGDFFTYADRDDHYWSGYFTSRPFHKSMDRELISHLRAAQIIFTLMSAEVSRRTGEVDKNEFVRNLLGKLIRARRNLSLFQHHDGVAGTAKDHVMVDYAEKLYTGLQASNYVMQQSLQVLTHLKDPSFDLEKISEDSIFYEPTFEKEHYNSLPRFNIIIIDRQIKDKLFTVYNPAARARTQLVSLYVSTYYVKVEDIEGESVEFEILPVFEDRTTLASNIFQINFVTLLEPLAIKSFIVKYDAGVTNVPQPKIFVLNSPSKIFDHEKFKIQFHNEDDPISIKNDVMEIKFKKTGLAKEVILNGKNDKKQHTFGIEFLKYGIKNRPESSGLYLFIPDGDATPISITNPFVKIVKGKFMSYVEVWVDPVVKHRVTLFNHPGFEQYSIDVSNVVDIRSEKNFELVMKMKTMINSNDISYTDLNGFQMIRRKRFAKIPLQANYYPLPAATYIEDSDVRMSVLSRQPLGTASLKSGEIEVILDRRIMQDDNRGAGQGDKDNLETINAFKVIFELPACQDKDQSSKPPMLSLASHITLHDLLHPFRTFTSTVELTPLSLSGTTDYNTHAVSANLACDVELVDMSMHPNYRLPLDDSSYVPTPQAAITVRRVGFDGRFLNNIPMPKCSIDSNHLGHFTLRDLVGDLFQAKTKQMTLSFLHEGKSLLSNESILMKPMEIYAFRVDYNSNLVDENDNRIEK